MNLQREKAADIDLEFTVDFENIGFADNTANKNCYNPMICCDEHRIMQVLQAIQANALKFTQKGKVETVVSVDHKEKGEHFLKISVKDTGIGIPDENKGKLFKLFGFMENTKENKVNQNGIGLGLVIAQMIVKQYDGTVEFESTHGKGSCFTFTFKIKAPY